MTRCCRERLAATGLSMRARGVGFVLVLVAGLATGRVPAAEAPNASERATTPAPPPKGPGGDPRPSAAGAGKPLGRVALALTRNLLAVDADPRALERAISQSAPPDVNIQALPAGTWLHGATPLTKTEAIPFAVSADRTILYFDSDRDGRLEAGERSAPPTVAGGNAWFAAHAPVRQEFEGRMHEHDVAFQVGVSLRFLTARSRLDCYRVGAFAGPTRTVKIAIADRTFRGWFTHPGLDAILVDVNGDGAFDASADSTERYRLGEPIPLDGIDAVVSAIAPLGASIELARSTKPARRIAALHLGAEAPGFEVRSMDGRSWKLADLRGKWVLLDFWATWCAPCRAEIPNLKRARADHADLIVLGLSADRARTALEQFVAAQAIDWPQVFEEAPGVQRTYRVSAYPTSFLLDPDGRIAARDLRGAGISAQIARLKSARGAPRAGVSAPPSGRSK